MAYDIGYEDYNSIRNMGSIPIVMFFVTFSSLLYVISILLFKLCKIKLYRYFKKTS